MIDRVISELEFVPADEETAIGELSGLPVAFTILGLEPLAGMFQFRVDSDGTGSDRVAELLAAIPEEDVSYSLEEKQAWLSFYHLERFQLDELCTLVRNVAHRLREISFAMPPGCLRCGETSDAKLSLVEGQPTRVCSKCLTEAVQERTAKEADLNRSRLSATIGLPFTGALVSAAWAIVWTGIDLLLERWNVRVIWLDYFTIVLIIMLAGGLGWLIGWPTGRIMRRSAAIQVAPYSTIGWFVCITALCGEILYFAAYLARFAGLFDFGLAAALFWQFVSMYSGFWILCKLALAAAIYGFCYGSATTRTEVAIDV